MGAPAEPMLNPSLLFLHGDVSLHTLLLPQGVRRYWPLQGSEHTDAALPNAGMLYAVDARPSNASSAKISIRYPRPDLWAAERGRARVQHERRGRRGGRKLRWK